jgi:hypothetical protein
MLELLGKAQDHLQENRTYDGLFQILISKHRNLENP